MRTGIFLAAFSAGAMLIAVAPAAAQSCEAPQGREAVSINGEISGRHLYNQAFGPGWFFQLTPADHGWFVQIKDKEGLDLAQMTPPLHGPNPREIFGWHFRNKDNTGANQGDVNAPQELRLFGFDPRFTGTGGVKPARGTDGLDDQPGRGAVFIRDYGLSDLAPGEKARMSYLKFDACLTWPSEYGPADPATHVISPELIEQMRDCGLGEEYALADFVKPVALNGDFTGKDYLSIAAPIIRKADGKRAIAVCRAGTWLDILGITDKIGEELGPGYFDKMNWWAMTKNQLLDLGEGKSIRIPDAILIGIESSSSALVFWDGAKWTSHWQGD